MCKIYFDFYVLDTHFQIIAVGPKIENEKDAMEILKSIVCNQIEDLTWSYVED